MKKLALIMFTLIPGILTSSIFAQDINWKNINSEYRHIINVNTGVDYGFVYGIGYSYKIKSKLPTVLNIEYEAPAGENLIDDFKTKTGAKINWYHSGNFYFSSKIQGVFRRQQTPLVRLLNFGSDLSSTIGYYKHRWFAAGELGFDKAIVTHFRHSAFTKENFPGIQDGWYEPATGGNFYYGIQAGISQKKIDIYLNFGKIVSQDFKTNPTVPVYAQLGINFKVKTRSHTLAVIKK
jgi:hypothetical protein